MSLRILPAVLAFVLLLAACGGSDDADAEEAMTEEATSEEASQGDSPVLYLAPGTDGSLTLYTEVSFTCSSTKERSCKR